MSYRLTNAIIAEIDPLRVSRDELRIEGDRIVERDVQLEPAHGETLIDCQGCLLMPGLVNGHTHLYSALAAGMPAPPRTPTNFHEILELVWWRLDRALDETSILASGVAGALTALRHGTTTLIDHHASPNCIEDSLDILEAGVARVGPRLVTCYEVTDRNGLKGAEEGLKENERYIMRCKDRNDRRHGALVGAHASFTCSNAIMDAIAGLAIDHHCGVHIHVAEDACDEEISLREFGATPVQRLARHCLLRKGTLLGHGIHLSPEDLEFLNATPGIAFAHNPRSNMNNAVGYAPLDRIALPVQLGTDGIGADMLTELQAAWFKSRDGGAGLTPASCVAMLAESARFASRALGVELGQLTPGAQADLALRDFRPTTPLTSGNLAGQLIFAIAGSPVSDVMLAGEWVMREGTIATCDEAEEHALANTAARELWKNMEAQ